MDPSYLDPHRHWGHNHEQDPSQDPNTVDAASGGQRAWDCWDDPSCSRVGWKHSSPPSVPSHTSEYQDLDPPGNRKPPGHMEGRTLMGESVLTSLGRFDGVSSSCGAEGLRVRVMDILQKKHSASFSTKGGSPKEKPDSSGQTPNLHPLRRRVKILMKQRRGGPAPDSPEVPPVSRVPPGSRVPPVSQIPQGSRVPPVSWVPPVSQIPQGSQVLGVSLSPPTSSANRQNAASRGFERFLSLLNQGVDIDLLSRIVNDDTDVALAGGIPLNAARPVREAEPSPARESQRLNDVDPFKPTTKEVQRHLGGRRCLSSGSQSKSPPPEKMKEEEKDAPSMVDDKSKQLQNIVRTLGLNLEVEDLSRLSDRTHQRLYGRKSEDGQTDSRKRDFHREHSSSSSFSRSSVGSSDIHSRSPSPDPRSHVADSRPRPEGPGKGRTEGARPRHGRRDDRWDQEDTSLCYHMLDRCPLAAQTSSYPPPASAAYSQYSLSSYSHCGGDPAPASHPYWTPDSASSSLYLGHPDVGGAPAFGDSHNEPVKNLVMQMSPDLAESEGQRGNVSDGRCLRFIDTDQSAAGGCLISLVTHKRPRKAPKRKKSQSTFQLESKEKNNNIQQFLCQTTAANASMQSQAARQKMEALARGDDRSEASEGRRRRPTEEEIKANLRKKLEAFNQKVKHNRQSVLSGVQPAAPNTLD